MTNFDFLKDFNNDLYQIGLKLEEDTINSPRAVTADATQFLETLVRDIYLKSNRKLDGNLISFYKKIDNLYRLGEITYIYKNKLQDAYNLRNKIHNSFKDAQSESNLAFELHKRLYYISKKYFRDYCDEWRDVNIPDYKKPKAIAVQFENCIICGCENSQSKSNMCKECNSKIDNVNILLTIKNTFPDGKFTKEDLIEFGISESESNSVLTGLLKENVISKTSRHYVINESVFQRHFEEIDQYIEIGLLLDKFYRDEITPGEIRSTLEYWKGGIKQKNYREFYRLVNARLEKSFEESIIEDESIKSAMKASSMDSQNVKEWFLRKKELFMEGDMDDSFILFNELLIKKYFLLKKRNVDDVKIKARLQLSDDIFDFWQNHFMSEDFFKLTTEIKKDLIIREVKKNKSLRDALNSVGISHNEFDRIYMMSKNSDDEFYRKFNEQYTFKRQKSLIKHLKNNNLNKAIKISKISKNEFFRWYHDGEAELNEFYMKTTEILMGKYLAYRESGWNKNEILNHLNIPKDMFRSWFKHDDLKQVIYFKRENARITSNLVKRGKIINALKEDKSKEEAIFSAELTPKEFLQIYNKSKKEKTDFAMRFDEEYRENRKRLFPKLLKDNDFYNAIVKCEITQKEFNSWYMKDQAGFLATDYASDFYIDTTRQLMDKYLKARMDGKNKPDAAKCVGLSNAVVDKWLRHVEFEFFWNFKRKHDNMEMDFVKEGFYRGKSRYEVSEQYDVSLKTIDGFLNLSDEGNPDNKTIMDLYESRVIPNCLKRFLADFKNKSFSKALKNSKLTLKEIDHYYELGKLQDTKFKWFYESFHELKINKYVDSIIAKKSPKIAFKNSNLTSDELKESQQLIEKMIMDERIDIVFDEIDRYKSTGTKIAKILGISVDELYDWYFKGKKGDEFYEEFSDIFEKGVIMPRVIVFNHAKSRGLPKNWISKQLKKELKPKEYSIWVKHDLLNKKELNRIDVYENVDDDDKIRSFMIGSEFISTCFGENDGDFFDFFKKALKANKISTVSPINISLRRFEEIETVGK